MHQKENTGSIVRATARPESDPDDPRQWAWVEHRCGRIVCWRPWVTGSEEVNGHQRWPNAFFAQHGLFTLQEAYTAASQSRKCNC
jgi:hypothetical protein